MLLTFVNQVAAEARRSPTAALALAASAVAFAQIIVPGFAWLAIRFIRESFS